jgi:glycosyltransferase involved in cell wall biosynthesis
VYLQRTLNSVIQQGGIGLQYAVVDGGSSDRSVEILRHHAGSLHYWESRPDKGQSEAVNRGFAHTDAPVMAYLNSDDVLLPNALSYVSDFFTENPDVDVIYGHRIVIDASDREIGRWILPPHDEEALRWIDFVPQETLFWRRTVWDRAGGGLDESLHFAMDWDLLLRFQDVGARFCRVPRFLAAFRHHPTQKTVRDYQTVGAEEINRLLQRTFGRVPTQAEIQTAVRHYTDRQHRAQVRWRLGMPVE